MKHIKQLCLVMVLIVILLSACGQSSTTSETHNWTWLSGSSTMYQKGVYGNQGIYASANIPGARYGSVSFMDSHNDLWLFGGYGYDSAGTLGYLNDLWQYDGRNWTWVSGMSIINQSGNYGTQGVSASTNIPGARYGAVSFTDSHDNLWLFGGWGVDGYQNDLWKYDATIGQWTWISGSSKMNQTGIYGTQGVTVSTNIPGARYGAVSFTDSHDNLWLFGGYGYDSAGTVGYLNDLWKYDGRNWTWESGSNIAGQIGLYGTQGIAGLNMPPGSRYGSVSFVDSYDNLWLFGGYGLDSAYHLGYLNDLWKYDGTNWTWVSGANVVNQTGNYATLGIPGARCRSISWIDSHNNLWIFGGDGYDSVGNQGFLNDLWKYDGMSWTWVSGGNVINQAGNYSTRGIPGARCGAISCIDFQGNFCLFGGSSPDGLLNDLWMY
jgi:N-acetylneuraminic acid mutarotase